MDKPDFLPIWKKELQRYETGYQGDKLIPILALIEPSSRMLEVTIKQGAEFVEKQILGRGFTVFHNDECTGLWHPLEDGLFKSSQERLANNFLGMWESGESHNWDLLELRKQGWDYLRLAYADGQCVIDEAERIGMAEPSTSTPLRPQSQPEGITSETLRRWPWGAHHTELLGHLEAAAKRFWVNYDPSETGTMPTNQEVSNWLQSDRGISRTMADAIASILRLDGLPTGPRK